MALGEPGAATVKRRLTGFSRCVASNLLEAEVRSALSREHVPLRDDLLEPVEWIMPTAPLSHEIAAVLAVGYVRGGDLWHLACALFVSPEPKALTFLTLDTRQRAVAERLGFAV
jgi:hypothetical protein